MRNLPSKEKSAIGKLWIWGGPHFPPHQIFPSIKPSVKDLVNSLGECGELWVFFFFLFGFYYPCGPLIISSLETMYWGCKRVVSGPSLLNENMEPEQIPYMGQVRVENYMGKN